MSRRDLRERTRPTRPDGSKYTTPPIRNRVLNRLRRAGKAPNGYKYGLYRTPPVPKKTEEDEE